MTSPAPLRIARLAPADRARWEVLARGYKAFYATAVDDAGYARAWQRLMEGPDVLGFGAHAEEGLVGIVHYLFHASTWADRVCYLQDLFVDETTRGRGVARALIDAVANAARAGGAQRLYWLTHSDNATARALYDQVAAHRGFLRYEYPLHGA